jgi:hypothetical protein
MEFVCLSEYGKLRRVIGLGDDREFIDNMRNNNFGHYKSVLNVQAHIFVNKIYKKI